MSYKLISYTGYSERVSEANIFASLSQVAWGSCLLQLSTEYNGVYVTRWARQAGKSRMDMTRNTQVVDGCKLVLHEVELIT